MAAMEPTRDELDAMVKITDVLDWVPVRGTLRAAFMAAIGAEDDDPTRVLASMREELFLETVGALKIEGVGLSPVQRTKLELAREVAMKAVGTTKTEAQKEKEAKDKADQEAQEAKTKAELEARKLDILATNAQVEKQAALEKQAAQTTNGKGEPVVKMSLVMDQCSDEVAPLMTRAEASECHKKYESKMDGQCPNKQKPSRHQL